MWRIPKISLYLIFINEKYEEKISIRSVIRCLSNILIVI